MCIASSKPFVVAEVGTKPSLLSCIDISGDPLPARIQIQRSHKDRHVTS